MIVWLGICLLLVMASLILALFAATRLDLLKRQNELMQREISLLRQEYQRLQEQVRAFPQIETSPAPESASRADKPPIASTEPEAELRAQMQQLEKLLQTYAQENEGLYPPSVMMLRRFADRQGHQRIVENPYTHRRNPLVSEDVCLDISRQPVDEGLAEHAGRLLFQARLDPQGEGRGFTLAAFDGQGVLLKNPDGSVLTLSYPANTPV